MQTLANSIIEHYGRTTYAVMAALQAAKVNADLGELGKAAEQLQWVIDKSGHEELRAIARVRLAGVLLDEKKFDAALQALAFDAPAGVPADRARPAWRCAARAEQDRRGAGRLQGCAGKG